jgi:hypothetical protein
MPDFLLTSAFPPLEGRVAREMGELVRRFPPGEVLVSTGGARGASGDASVPPGVALDRMGLSPRRLRSLPGLMLWARRVARLAREHRPGALWCGQVRPSAVPARWVQERLNIPYGILVDAGELAALQHRMHQSRVLRGAIRSLLGAARALVVANDHSADLCRAVLGELGLPAAEDVVRVMPRGGANGDWGAVAEGLRRLSAEWSRAGA